MDGGRLLQPAAADPADAEASSATKSHDAKMLDCVSSGWTDEKHSLYLNSMEASFVNQLYSSDYLPKDFLGWYSNKGKNKGSSGSSANSVLPHEFKVQRGGRWTNVKFERAKRRVDNEKESHPLSTNPWIQHFRPTSGKDPDLMGSKKDEKLNITPSYQADHNLVATHTDHLASLNHGREATSSKQLPADLSHLCYQDSLGCNAEVSDQNFVDEEVEKEVQPSRSCCKKRVRTFVNDRTIKDQVVPSGKSSLEPNSYARHAHMREEVAECTSGKPAGVSGDPYLEPESSFLKDQELNSEGLK